jgi:mono/diheme cytochrome c family protein
MFLSIRCSSDSKPITGENAKKGELLFNSSGCSICHSFAGETRYGPPLNFMFEKEVTVFRRDIKKVIMLDRKYIIRSIKYPDFEKLDGYTNKTMPPAELSDDEIAQIADYLIYVNTKKAII